MHICVSLLNEFSVAVFWNLGNQQEKIEYSFTSDIINSGERIGVAIEIKNRGLVTSNGPVTVNLESLNSLVHINETEFQLDQIDSWESQTFNFEIDISEQIVYYSKVGIELIVHDANSYARRDTIEFYINGFSSSLPEEVQLQGLRTIKGFEKAKMFPSGNVFVGIYFSNLLYSE